MSEGRADITSSYTSFPSTFPFLKSNCISSESPSRYSAGTSTSRNFLRFFCRRLSVKKSFGIFAPPDFSISCNSDSSTSSKSKSSKSSSNASFKSRFGKFSSSSSISSLFSIFVFLADFVLDFLEIGSSILRSESDNALTSILERSTS